MAGLNSGEVRVAGTGAFYRAPSGTVCPTDSTTAWGAAFVHLGFADDGFTMKQDLKTKGISGWQTLEELRLIVLSLIRSFNFELVQSNKSTLGLAWGGATITPNAVTLGSVTIAITTGVVTVSAAHTLAVGDPVVLGAMTAAAPLVAGTTYYVQSIPTATTLTLAATVGGALIATTTAGSSLSITKVTGAYALAIPDASMIGDFVLGFDWSDGTTSQRFILKSARQTSLPTIKYVRTDAIRYAIEVQAMKPSDGSNSVLVYGVDTAAVTA